MLLQLFYYTKKQTVPHDTVCQIQIKGDYSSLILAKHSLQYTGRSSLGLKGTLATPPQDAHVASNISLSALAPFLRALRQLLHL